METHEIVEFKELLKGKIYPDNIKPLIDEMNRLSENLEYEKAQKVLENIKEELKKSESNFPFEIETIKDTYDLVTSHSIRLNPENYKFSDFLGLVFNVHSRKGELQGMRYIDIDRQRKVVAEEMACLGISVPAKRIGRKPNRAFLDIAHKISPFVACKELERREKVMMWKAIESGRKEDIEKVREKLRKYRPPKII